MENIIKRIARSTVVTIFLLMVLVLPVFAAPGNITNFSGTATDTTVSLLWTVASSSNSTVIRYSTTTFPATPAAGSAAYSGTSYYTTVSSLTSGTTYYFSAWGYDGADYSATAATFVITTGGISAISTTPAMTTPALPANSDPDTSGWSIAPFDYIASYFASEGLDMPVNNLWMAIASIIVTFIGIITYIKWRSFFTSWTLVFLLSAVSVSAHIMQGLVIVIELGIGIGVAAIERYYQ